jgi:hypothetical protein
MKSARAVLDRADRQVVGDDLSAFACGDYRVSSVPVCRYLYIVERELPSGGSEERRVDTIEAALIIVPSVPSNTDNMIIA